MKYYRISDLIDLKIIGNYPQIENVKCNCDPLEDPLFIDNIGYRKVDFIPKTPIGILNERVKLTDSLTSPAMGYTNKLIISTEFKNTLLQFESDNFQLFESEIEIHKAGKVYYWVLNPINFNYENIDYNKSEIFLITSYFSKGEILNIKSSQDLIKEQEKINDLGYPYQLHIEKLILNSNNNKDFVIIDNVKGGIGYFVSEKLKTEIERKGLTGILFVEL